MVVSYDENAVSEADIIGAVVKAGYGASVAGSAKSGTGDASTSSGAADAVLEEVKQMKRRLIISIIFTLPIFYISMGHMMGWPLPDFLLGDENAVVFVFTQFILMMPVVFVNFKFYRIGFKTLIQRAPNMDSLIALGATASVVYSVFAIYAMAYYTGHGDLSTAHHYGMELYFESAAMILTLITVGKYMESRAKGKTSEAIAKLMDLAPKTAVVERDGKEMEIPIEQVVTGDVIVVRPGQSIPVDGEIIE